MGVVSAAAVPPGAPVAAGAAVGVPAAAAGARVSTGAFAGCGALACFGGALWQAASIASRLALTNRFDQLLTDLHLAVTAWIELRQRGEALLHPLIVGAVLRPRRVDFVQFDGLLLERESLLLEQHVVLFQFVLGKILGPLGAHQVL